MSLRKKNGEKLERMENEKVMSGKCAVFDVLFLLLRVRRRGERSMERSFYGETYGDY